MYKIGFTTLKSAHERLAYQGNGHEKYIDKVLFFVYLEDAWDTEQTLHKCFSGKAIFCGWKESMPLFGNGQSELYRHDVLAKDASYTDEQAESTRVNILVADYKNFGSTEEQLKMLVKNQQETYKSSWLNLMRAENSAPAAPPSIGVKALRFIFQPFLWLIFGSINLITMLIYPNERSSQELVRAIVDRIEDAQMEQRIERQIRINQLTRELEESKS